MNDAARTAAGWRVLGLTCGAVFMVSLDATVTVAAFPELRRHFADVSPAWLSWVLNAYTLTYAALLVPLGRWGDAHGWRRAFLLGLAWFTAASAACGFAPDATTLIAARAAQAIGGALLTPAALALVLQAVPNEKRALAVSLWGAVGALAAALGPACGSWLIEAVSWRAIFWINLPAGIVIGRLGVRALDESNDERTATRPDWTGSALLAGGVGLMTFGCLQAGESGARMTAALAGGVALLACFVAWARGRPHAALDLSLFQARNYRFANLGTLVFGTAFGLMFLASFLFLTGVWGYSQSRAGLAATVGPLMVIPFAVLGGRWAGQRGHRPPLVVGGVLYAAGQLWYLLHLAAQPDYAGAWLPGQLASGAGIGLVLPSLAGAAVADLPAAALGAGNAVNAAIRQLGSVIGVALGVMLVGHAGASVEQFRPVYLALAIGGLATAVLALPINTKQRRPA